MPLTKVCHKWILFCCFCFCCWFRCFCFVFLFELVKIDLHVLVQVQVLDFCFFPFFPFFFVFSTQSWYTYFSTSSYVRILRKLRSKLLSNRSTFTVVRYRNPNCDTVYFCGPGYPVLHNWKYGPVIGTVFCCDR